VLLHGQVLQDPGFNFGRQHALARFLLWRQWNFHVHKGQRLVRQRHKVFALDDGEQ
jgi:hypothetical protein